MISARQSALRPAFTARLVRPARHISGANTQRWQQAFQRQARRGYASLPGPIKKAGSDLPWLAGAVAVTIPGCWYFLQPSSGHDHDEHHGDSREGHQQTLEGDEGKGIKGGEMEQEQNEPTPEGEPASRDEAHIVKQPESKGSAPGVQFKGATSHGGDDKAAPDTRKHIPDAKGGAKKRIESGYGQSQGIQSEDEGEGDKPAASKKPGDQNTTSGKQAGLSNTDTKHSVDVSNDPSKSKKGEGSVETAKVQGSVDPSRPTPEQKNREKTEKGNMNAS